MSPCQALRADGQSVAAGVREPQGSGQMSENGLRYSDEKGHGVCGLGALRCGTADGHRLSLQFSVFKKG